MSISCELNFINRIYCELNHCLKCPYAESPSRARRIDRLSNQVLERSMTWQTADTPLRELNTRLFEVATSLRSIQHLYHATQRIAATLFAKIHKWLFYRFSEPPQIQLVRELSVKLANLTQDIIAQANSPLPTIEDKFERYTAISSLLKSIEEVKTRALETAHKVNAFSKFLRWIGIKKQAVWLGEEFNQIKFCLEYTKRDLQNLIIEKGVELNFGYFQYFSEYLYNQTTEKEDFISKSQLMWAQKKAYHLISSQLSEEQLAEVNLSQLNGGQSNISLGMTKAIIVELFGDTMPFLVNQLDNAMVTAANLERGGAFTVNSGPIANEECFHSICQFIPIIKAFEQKKQDLIQAGTYVYDQDVIRKWSENASPHYSKLFNGACAEYTRNKELPLLSIEVFISYIIQDFMNKKSILQKPGDYFIIPLSFPNHSILVEFAMEADETFSLSVFNTGTGIQYHLITENDDQEMPTRAKPLKIGGLVKEDLFNFHFIAALAGMKITAYINAKPQEEVCDYFYDLLYQSILENGENISDSCPDYPIQRRGRATCSYSSIEVWLQSRLSEEQMQSYLQATVECAAKKLRRANKGHQEHLKSDLEIYYLMNMFDESLTEEDQEHDVEAMKEEVTKAAQQTTILLENTERLCLEYNLPLEFPERPPLCI
ncbi:conserved hypothetical protein [Candidatus Protochlamydia naegleriophila]|uniref:Uncharacterized protein n=2 Tax=Candidatus Protochlamydia naegleriophila TaxID=389348 RepID=A0A0U5JCM0_9BACT|nr:conserved hypothetical protein [Candidatus Protochlamydia naegleriophila]